MVIRHDGRAHTVVVTQLPVERCGKCGEFTVGADGDARINESLQEHLGLLTPDQMRSRRKRLDITQSQLAEAIGCAGESISRWETGSVVQSRASDRLLRAYFDVPAVREYFAALDGKGEYVEGVGDELFVQPAFEPAAPPYLSSQQVSRFDAEPPSRPLFRLRSPHRSDTDFVRRAWHSSPLSSLSPTYAKQVA